MDAVLYVFSGLPASGKSTLARRLARHAWAAYLRIDTIEQALRDLCGLTVQGEGYRLAYRIAADNLRNGLCVVADSCNPIALTRHEWDDVAFRAGVEVANIEVVCSDAVEHRRRVEERSVDVEGLVLPGWSEVQKREYQAWTAERIVVDTAGRSVDDSFGELLTRLGRNV